MSTLSRISLLALLTVTLSSCSTMYFTRGKAAQANLEHEEWHHDGVFGLIEFSLPVDLNDRCGGKDWSTVKVEKTFLNGLAEAVVNSIFAVPVVTAKATVGTATLAFHPRSSPLYDPWTVSYSCR